MSKRYPDLLIEDMLDCIAAIQSYTAGMTLDAILDSGLHKDAIIRNFEVLGEAANQLPKSVQALAPEVPWGNMVGMRNRLIHEYHGINWDIVIRTMLTELPKLATQLEALHKLAPTEITIERDDRP
jgi:uncharacterized protein with HEPN domain